MVDMAAYRVSWVTEVNPWDPVEGFLDCPERLLHEPQSAGWSGEIPVFEHQDFTLRMPSTVSKEETDLGVLANSWLV